MNPENPKRSHTLPRRNCRPQNPKLVSQGHFGHVTCVDVTERSYGGVKDGLNILSGGYDGVLKVCLETPLPTNKAFTSLLHVLAPLSSLPRPPFSPFLSIPLFFQRPPSSLQPLCLPPNNTPLTPLGNSTQLWDTRMGIAVRTCAGSLGPVLKCAISRDKKQIIAVGADTLIRLWDTVTMGTVPPFTMENPPGAAKVGHKP
jgi:WD40 repeat protein